MSQSALEQPAPQQPVSAAPPPAVIRSFPVQLGRLVRLALLDRLTVLWTPLIIAGGASVLTLGMRVWLGGRPGAEVEFVGAAQSMYFFVVAAGILLTNGLFALGLGLGATRRQVLAGLGAVFVLLSAGYAAAFTVLSLIEQASGGWWLGIGVFATSADSAAAPLPMRFIGYLGTGVLAFVVLGPFVALQLRWSTRGVIAGVAIAIVGLIAFSVLVVRTQLGQVLGAVIGWLGLGAPFVTAVVIFAITWLLLRRAAP